MLPDSFVLTSNSLSLFYKQHPIDFFLYDEEGNPNLYILNDNVPGKTHHLILINESEQELKLQPASRDQLAPGPNNFHFELRFRPGTLAPEFFNWITVGVGEWRIQPWRWKNDPVVPDETISLFLLYHLDTPLHLPARSSRLIPLHGIKAGIGSGSRGAGAELRYRSADGAIQPRQTTPGSRQHFRLERMEILNQRGVKDIPVRAGFAGGDTVLNNGATNNTLHIQLTNTLRNNVIPILGRRGETASRMVLSFDTSERAEHWALLDEDNAANVLIEINDHNTYWHVEKETQGQTVQWILSPAEDVELDAGNSMRINLSQLISDMPAGTTNLYLSFENVPGYWDGVFTLPVEKSPFFLAERFDEKNNPTRAFVGLGTHDIDKSDNAPLLQIDGGVSADFVHLNGELSSDELVFNDSLKGQKDGKTQIAIRASDGTISIGETDPFSIQKDGNTLNVGRSGASSNLRLHAQSVLFDEFEIVVHKEGSHKYLEVKQNNAVLGGFIPRGGIIMWSGAETAVPAGWALCKGGEQDGLAIPDLRSRFIVGAGQGEGLSNYSVHDKKGTEQHKLTLEEIPRHSHKATIDPSDGAHQHQIPVDEGGGGTDLGFQILTGAASSNHFMDSNSHTQIGGSHTHKISVSESGSGHAHENRPPYYALAFIIKL